MPGGYDVRCPVHHLRELHGRQPVPGPGRCAVRGRRMHQRDLRNSEQGQRRHLQQRQCVRRHRPLPGRQMRGNRRRQLFAGEPGRCHPRMHDRLALPRQRSMQRHRRPRRHALHSSQWRARQVQRRRWYAGQLRGLAGPDRVNRGSRLGAARKGSSAPTRGDLRETLQPRGNLPSGGAANSVRTEASCRFRQSL